MQQGSGLRRRFSVQSQGGIPAPGQVELDEKDAFCVL
jgi:hypothetical protein